jgi:hypothetical protein
VVINYDNSSSPETEREIVSANSYGRQIGRLIDALCVLINKQENTPEGAKTLADLVALHAEIQSIKLKTAERKIERLRGDLETIKKKNPKDYDKMITALKQLLDHNS